MKRFILKVFLKIPFVDENDNSCGGMFRIVKNPVHLPRVGESIYVLPDIYLKVTDVRYSAPGLNLISITLEPLLKKYQKDLEKTPSLKGAHSWMEATVHPK
jgi:hypothetical protein